MGAIDENKGKKKRRKDKKKKRKLKEFRTKEATAKQNKGNEGSKD